MKKKNKKKINKRKVLKKKVLKKRSKLKKNNKKIIKKKRHLKKNYNKKKKKSKKPKKFKKIKQPLDRILSVKFPKFKLKKIKIPKLKKKQIFKIKKRAGQVAKIRFQSVVNFMLTPFFRAYDNYFENKKIKKLEKIAAEKKEKDKQKKEEGRIRLEIKKKELQQEKKIEIERKKDLKQFILAGQAILRKEKAEEKRKLYETMRIQRRLDQFARRETKEIADLEKYALREQISEYSSIQERIDSIRKKYAEIREAKFRKSYEDMGIDVQLSDSRADLYEKHRIFEEQRKKVEQVLESFFRSAQSLTFQLNRRWIPKDLEILRVIDRRWEEDLFYVRLDNEIEDNWLQLIYLEDGKVDKPVIVVEDKTSEKYITKRFNTSSIFEYSDWMVDRWTQFLDREFSKKKKN